MIWKSLTALFSLYLCLIAFLFVTQRDLIYNPDITALPKTPYNIQIQSSDGLTLNAFFTAPLDKNTPVILHFHGNAGNASHRTSKTAPLVKNGYGVLLAEYRGYGGNDGSPTEDSLYNDARAYHAWLIDQNYANIILYGESLGTGIATQLATEINATALILETPFARLSDPAKARYPFIPFIDHLVRDKYNSLEKLKNLDTPKLIIIAGQDEVLGTKTGLKLYEAAKEPKTLEIYEQATHNTVYNFGAADDVIAFIDALTE